MTAEELDDIQAQFRSMKRLWPTVPGAPQSVRGRHRRRLIMPNDFHIDGAAAGQLALSSFVILSVLAVINTVPPHRIRLMRRAGVNDEEAAGPAGQRARRRALAYRRRDNQGDAAGAPIASSRRASGNPVRSKCAFPDRASRKTVSGGLHPPAIRLSFRRACTNVLSSTHSLLPRNQSDSRHRSSVKSAMSLRRSLLTWPSPMRCNPSIFDRCLSSKAADAENVSAAVRCILPVAPQRRRWAQMVRPGIEHQRSSSPCDRANSSSLPAILSRIERSIRGRSRRRRIRVAATARTSPPTSTS